MDNQLKAILRKHHASNELIEDIEAHITKNDLGKTLKSDVNPTITMKPQKSDATIHLENDVKVLLSSIHKARG